MTDKELETYFFIKDEIPQITGENICNIENNGQENEYFLNTGDILFKYYEHWRQKFTKSYTYR